MIRTYLYHIICVLVIVQCKYYQYWSYMSLFVKNSIVNQKSYFSSYIPLSFHPRFINLVNKDILNTKYPYTMGVVDKLMQISKKLPILPTILFSSIHSISDQINNGAMIKSIKESRFHDLNTRFVDILSQTLNIRPHPIPKVYQIQSSIIRNENVLFTCTIYSTTFAKYVRTVRFYGSDYDVFNFVIIPNYPEIQPILGIDLVVIKDKAIIAIDFQPCHHSTSLTYDSIFYKELSKKFQYWSDKFSERIEVPEKYREYFSNYALFLRINSNIDNNSNDSSSSSTITTTTIITTDPWKNIYDCSIDYLTIYVNTLVQQHPYQLKDNKKNDDIYEEKLREYLEFRILNDPAKNILITAFGKNWTSLALAEAIFPYNPFP